MSELLTRIDPELPVCWEDAHTLRVGFDRAHARIDDPDPAAQRLISALISGVPTDDLPGRAMRCGLDHPARDRLLEALAPALVTEQPEPAERLGGAGHRLSAAGPDGFRAKVEAVSGAVRPRLRVRVCDGDRPLEPLRALLAALGCHSSESTRGRLEQPDVVIVVERFLEPLQRVQRWLAADVPLLRVRFTDRSIRVGPLVAESGSPCITCITLGLVDHDPGLPALAAQLIGRRPASETVAGIEHAALLALSFLRHWEAGDERVHRFEARSEVSRGLVSALPRFSPVGSHPQCTCWESPERS